MKKMIVAFCAATLSLAAHGNPDSNQNLQAKLDETYTQVGFSAQVVGRQYEDYQATFVWGLGGKLDASYALGDNFVVLGDARFLSASSEQYGNQLGNLSVRGAYRLNNRMNVFKAREWSLRAGGQYIWQEWEAKQSGVSISSQSSGMALNFGFNLREINPSRTHTDVWVDFILADLESNLSHSVLGWSWNRRVGDNFLGVETGLQAGTVRGLFVGFRFALMP